MKNIELNKLISKRITYLREQQNLTIEKLAYTSGISKGGLSEIENYKKEPKINTILKICSGLGISAKDFFDFIEIEDYTNSI